MAIDYTAIAAAGGIAKGESRRDEQKRKRAVMETNWERVCKAVDARDTRRCRVCGRWTNPEALTLLERGHRHHLQYRSLGGPDTTANVCTLCADCHEDEHRGRIALSGNADHRDEMGKLAGICVQVPKDGRLEIVAWV